MPKALSSTQTKCVMLEADNTSTIIDSATFPLHTRKLAAWTVSQLLSRHLHLSFPFSLFEIRSFGLGSKDLADRNKRQHARWAPQPGHPDGEPEQLGTNRRAEDHRRPEGPRCWKALQDGRNRCGPSTGVDVCPSRGWHSRLRHKQFPRSGRQRRFYTRLVHYGQLNPISFSNPR
jgi:hypothetical protein